MANLKPFLDGTKVALEKQAVDRFGAAVEDFSKGTLGPKLGQTAPLAREQIPFNRGDGSFYASSYAHALAGPTPFRPKLKFLFKVEFVFTTEAKNAFPEVFGGAHSQDFTFMVRSVDRPKIDFEYDDDVNMYNFRTKVLKRIRHRELTITFMDDIGNRVINFFRYLMMLQSPITRRQMQREGTTAPPEPYKLQFSSGMQFIKDITNPSKMDNAHRGVVDNTFGNVIESIRVKQVYVDSGAQLGSAVKETIYDFINARIVSFDLDELTHETSDASLMTMQFDYDWMEIVDVGVLQKMDGPHYNIAVPGVGGAPVDMATPGRSTLSNPGGGNPFLNIINNQVGRAAQTISSSAINRAVAQVAGNGRFASALGSQASNILGGLVGAASRDLVSGLSLPTNQAVARGSAPTVIDSAQGGPTPVAGVTPSRDYPEAREPTGNLVTTDGVKRWVPDQPEWSVDGN